MNTPRQDRIPEPAYYAALGRAIQVVRAELGISRRELASRSGISYSYMADIEKGRRKLPANRILAIAQALKMTPSDLLARAERYVGSDTDGYGMPPPLSDVAFARRQVEPPPDEMMFRESSPGEAAHYLVTTVRHPDERGELHRLIDSLDPRDFGLVASFLRRLLRG